MATTEHSINDALAEVLRGTRRIWKSSAIVSSETTGKLKGSSKRPDILVIEPDVSPVVIETEIMPAATVEPEAVSRLGEQLRKNGRRILSSVAVRIPSVIASLHGEALRNALAATEDLEFALFTGVAPAVAQRWPSKGWISGSAADLSLVTQSASVPPDVIEVAANQLVNGVSEAAGLIADMAEAQPAAIHKISEHLRQEDGEQTRRMAATILANAFVFHESLAGGPGDLASVKSVDELRAESGALLKSEILSEWRKILKVNYWPIFDIARRILEAMPAPNSKALLDTLASTASKLLENRLMRSHDLTGAVFQRLIADRKFLAAYYTTPASAALLVGLALPSKAAPGGAIWSDVEGMKALRVADFACGTGTLLSTAYQRIGQLHELSGGDIEALHPQMMAHTFTGCDVLPAAAHLTAAMLSGAHPMIKYKQSSILSVAYGKQPDGGIALGSLDLLDPQRKLSILDITAKSVEGMGESEKEIWASLPHASFHLVIMNPPFTRATSHEGNKSDVPNPVFAAFGTADAVQAAMAEKLKRLAQGTAYNGNAGEASAFVAIGDKKLTDDGVLALVLPLSFQAGSGWDNARQLLRKNYDRICVVNIAANRDDEASFSADTGMAECLVVARKRKGGSTRGLFVMLSRRPRSQLEGAVVAQQIARRLDTTGVRRLEDGPIGGESIRIGEDFVGVMLDGPVPTTGSWPINRIADATIAQTAFQLVNKKRLWLPGTKDANAFNLPMRRLADLADVGPLHRDINGTEKAGGVMRGPFTIETIPPGQQPTYPTLWAHEANNERTMLVAPDKHAVLRTNAKNDLDKIIRDRGNKIWETASHVHFNYDFRFNSQSTAACYTKQKSIGGRAWPSLKFKKTAHEKVFLLWANSTLGLMCHWWHANKTQAGRGTITLTSIPDLLVYDFDQLSAAQLKCADNLFDSFIDKSLRPMNEIGIDASRHALDRHVLIDVLGLPAEIMAADGPFDLLRRKLAAEPSVHGGKGGKKLG